MVAKSQILRKFRRQRAPQIAWLTTFWIHSEAEMPLSTRTISTSTSVLPRVRREVLQSWRLWIQEESLRDDMWIFQISWSRMEATQAPKVLGLAKKSPIQTTAAPQLFRTCAQAPMAKDEPSAAPPDLGSLPTKLAIVSSPTEHPHKCPTATHSAATSHKTCLLEVNSL